MSIAEMAQRHAAGHQTGYQHGLDDESFWRDGSSEIA